MSANTEALGGRPPVRLPAWIVVGVGLALAGALAVVSISERDTVPRPDTGVVVGEGPAGAQTDYAEMAALKAAVARQFWAREHGITAVPGSGLSEAVGMAELKSSVSAELRARQETTSDTDFSYGDNTAPIVIDGELCGQCR